MTGSRCSNRGGKRGLSGGGLEENDYEGGPEGGPENLPNNLTRQRCT